MVRQRAHRNESLRSPRGQYKTQLAAEKQLCTHTSIIFFRAGLCHYFAHRTFAFTIHSPAWETAPICASICSPSKNPCDSDPFGSQLTIDVRLHENQFLYARSRMKRHISLFFLSTAERRLTAGHLDKIFCTRLRSRMGGIFRSLLSTAERRLTRAIFGTQSRSSYELK